MRTRQKRKKGNGKGESNDSPEIPHRGLTDVPGLPSVYVFMKTETILSHFMRNLQTFTANLVLPM